MKGGARGDLDTRADVYALGLVLYKLLAGTQPYESDEQLLDRMLSIARVDTPPQRQHYASLSAEKRDDVAKQRGTTPAALERVLRSDLEPIVLRALVDSEQRYGSASELQADIRRFLAHEPVEASAPSTFARMRKFAVRHRGAVAATALIAITLIAGIVARTIEARRAREAHRQAELVTQFLQNLFDEGIPHNGKGTEVSMHDMLLEGEKRIEAGLQDAPLARAQVLNSIGTALTPGRRRPRRPSREALDIRRKELGAENPLVANTRVELGVLRQRYDLAEGEKFLREAARIREKVLGPNDPWLANTLADLADVRRQQNQFGDAEKLLLRSISIREKILAPTDPSLAASYSGLGRVYRAWEKFDLAEKYLFRALDLSLKAYGPDHYVTSRSYDSIAELRMA